jgi:hypothetical protein
MEYALGIWKALKAWPQQIVLYVGYEPMRMRDRFQAISTASSTSAGSTPSRALFAESPCSTFFLVALLYRGR